MKVYAKDRWPTNRTGATDPEPLFKLFESSLSAGAHDRHQVTVWHYWMTSSARARSEFGMVTPSAFAVLRLTTRSCFVACSTRTSAGFAPLRTLSTKSAALRSTAGRSTP